MKSAALTATLAALLLTTGCAAIAETASEAKAMVASKASAAETITMAKAKYAEAKGKGCAWRDTNKMIKSAEKLVADGQEEKAQSLAARAMRQSESGLEQCESEEARLGS